MCDLCRDTEEPCCSQGECSAIKSLWMCECCGGEMFEEKGFWFHHSQRDIPFEDRKPQWVSDDD